MMHHFVSQALSRPIKAPTKIVPVSVKNRRKARDEGIQRIVTYLARNGERSTKSIAIDLDIKADTVLKWGNVAVKEGLLTKTTRTASSDGVGGLTNVAFWRIPAELGVWGV